MKEINKIKEQLINELKQLRWRVAVLETSKAEGKQAEAALRESEERYRLLAENATDVIWTMDMNLKYTYISPSVIRLRGYSVEESRAQPLEEHLTPASLELAMKIFEEEMAIERSEQKDFNKARSLELELICKDGSTVWTEMKMTFLHNPDGRPVGILGVTRDITKRKRAREEILEKKNFYESILDGTFTGVWVAHRDDVIYYVNRGMTEIAGVPADKIEGRRVLKDFPESAVKFLRSHYLKARETLQPLYYDTISVVTFGGRQSYQSGWLIPRVNNGVFDGMICTVEDITIQRDLEDLSTRLVDLQEKEKRRIAGELHDAIGGALTGMAIELELLSKTPSLKGKPQEPHFLSIRDQLHKTIDMVQMISYELRPALLDDLGLTSALRWYVDSFRVRSGIGARLRISLAEERLPEAIEIALFRITQEALTNISRHSKASTVSVTLSKRKANLVLNIKDDGVGFDPDGLVQDPGKRGFGLFGIRERLKGVGGRLDLQSEPGQGTLLVVTIPIAQ